MAPFDKVKLPSRDGFDLRAEAWYDEYMHEPDGDGYTEEDREAFARGDWGYCGVVVTASRAGVDLGTDSIWGTEYGHIPGCDHWIDPLDQIREGSCINYYGESLICEAIDQAKRKIAEINAGQRLDP